ncbi:MAG: phosphate acyltransferase PlsX [Deltaproteobacteria bacterium]|nr:phosphate acyltransferase PlsX [Deltaproteobacteria bacterium]
MSPTIALDAMGGDHAPQVPIEAALVAARSGVAVFLVGPEDILRPALARATTRAPSNLEIIHAPEVIHMAEAPSQAARRKRDSSIAVAFRLVHEGKASAMVSAGNSGAVMATGLFEGGRIAGVQRPALAAAAPTKKEPVLVLDLGANTDPSPSQMAQFAIMGAAYAKTALHRPRPRVGLLTNGTEEGKGTDLTRHTDELLRGLGLDYKGYCEGGDLFEGNLDVVVVDGYTGNVSLKVVEGFMKAIAEFIETEVKKSVITLAGSLFMRRLIPAAKKRLDHEAAGGASLLGLKPNAIVAHGASSVRALGHAIRAAQALAECDVTRAIEAEIAAHPSLFKSNASTNA